MKNLPDRPNIDHLRQQAKDLLARLRGGHPETTLSDAQHRLAEEYGYRSWPDLKAEVDRRRGDVPSGDDDAATLVCKELDLGVPTGPMVPTERGWAGQQWAVVTPDGEYVLTEIGADVWTGNVDDEVRLVTAARAAGVAAPMPVSSPDGDVIVEVADRRWRAHQALDFGPPVIVPVDLGTAGAIGQALGTVHGLRLTASAPVSPWLTQRPSAEEISRLAERARQHQAPWSGQLDAALPGLVSVAEVGRDADPGDDAVLSHASFSPSSVRQGPDGSVTVVGWEHASAIPPAWELASVVWTFGRDGQGHADTRPLAALVEGYRSGGGTVPQLELASYAGAVSAWLNWLTSRIGIALDTNADTEARRTASREVPGLLARPMTREGIEALVTAAGLTTAG